MNIIRKLIRFKRNWNQWGALIETNDVIIRAARRCAYDLAHASTDIFCHGDPTNKEVSKISKEWHDRSNMWLNVFNPLDDGKHYRNKFHIEIDRLESKINKIVKHCHDNDLIVPRELIDDDPF